ncbi:S-layer protein [Methanocaldococcus sp. FS406-22]|uniref:S-layer protein n=1 Tax=Methanocaldococcus sp. (strain FS406-22) TaxID=644281 RepID=UPI0001BF2481|nr:S-layer protein [Methanocaldococcus sp. FS406-22]ADC70018.1 S-layer protein [Methanocaldococcus sp. FS406-22]
MAMSLKKIGAIAVGGAMVATALASGVAAEVTVIGEVTKDLFVKDGQPNCYVVVGANAPSTMDVVSAADIAAKIGSLCYKEGTAETGSADLNVHVSADASKVWFNTSQYDNFTYIVTPDDGDYPLDNGIKYANDLYYANQTTNNRITKTLSTLMKIDDVDPKNIYTVNDDDGIEIGFFALKNESNEIGVDLVGYASVVTDDGKMDTNNTYLAPGVLIPFLGQQYMFVKADADNDDLIIGKMVYNGVLGEGETYDLGNGYQAKIKAVLEATTSGSPAKVDVQILKDGQVVAEKFDIANTTNPLVLTYGPVAAIVTNAYKNVAATTGYADVYLVNDVKRLHLGDKYEGNFKIYAVVQDPTTDQIDIVKDTDITDSGVSIKGEGKVDGKVICGIALVDDTDPTNDDNKLSAKGDEFDAVDDYFKLKVDDTQGGDDYKIYVCSDVTKDAAVDVGQTVSVLNADITLKDIKAETVTPVSLTAPIAKLDTEVSLDTADKNLVLVGGPVANKLTKELVDEGKLVLNNSSPATIAVIPGAANGHDVVVVAGGNREETRAAALELLKML